MYQSFHVIRVNMFCRFFMNKSDNRLESSRASMGGPVTTRHTIMGWPFCPLGGKKGPNNKLQHSNSVISVPNFRI